MAKDIFRGPLEQVDACCWRIPKSYKQGMRVDGLIFTNERLLEQLKKDQAPEQVANVAFLPGIQHASLAMPDIHWGYGFCIGGVCATDPEEGGVISPGGVGYDINCLHMIQRFLIVTVITGRSARCGGVAKGGIVLSRFRNGPPGVHLGLSLVRTEAASADSAPRHRIGRCGSRRPAIIPSGRRTA